MGRIHCYETEEIRVEFDLSRCIHSGDCTRGLPEVFSVRRSGRWVKPDRAPASEIARICARCPTGALRCISKAGNRLMDVPPERNTVQVIPDGPLYVHADMIINGEPALVYRAAFCRCGASRLMPYCDNSHREKNFHDAGLVASLSSERQTGSGQLEIYSMSDGPLMIRGGFTLMDMAGHEACVHSEAALCRCGASKAKPYCDGSHVSSGFQSDT